VKIALNKKEALIRKYIYEYKNKGETGKTTLTIIRELDIKIRTQTFYRLWREQKITEQKVLSEKPKQKITIPEKLKRQIPAKSKMFTIRVILVNLKTRKIVIHQVQVFETSSKFAKSEAKDTAENYFNNLGGSPTWKAFRAIIVSIQRI
jgi:hypothetical protein